MRELANEYGKVIIALIAFLMVVALALTTPILGMNGLLAASEDSSPITGSATTGLKETDDVKRVNFTNEIVMQPGSDSYCVSKNTVIPLNSLLDMCTGNASKTFSLVSALDENKNNCLETGKVEYNRSTHKIKFCESGFYSLTVRMSQKGQPLEKYSFALYAE